MGKNQIRISYAAILIIFMAMSVIRDGSAFQTTTNGYLTAIQTYNNQQIVGDEARNATYLIPNAPVLNGENLSHEYTQLDITRCRSLETLNSSLRQANGSEPVDEYVQYKPPPDAWGMDLVNRLDEPELVEISIPFLHNATTNVDLAPDMILNTTLINDPYFDGAEKYEYERLTPSSVYNIFMGEPRENNNQIYYYGSLDFLDAKDNAHFGVVWDGGWANALEIKYDVPQNSVIKISAKFSILATYTDGPEGPDPYNFWSYDIFSPEDPIGEDWVQDFYEFNWSNSDEEIEFTKYVYCDKPQIWVDFYSPFWIIGENSINIDYLSVECIPPITPLALELETTILGLTESESLEFTRESDGRWGCTLADLPIDEQVDVQIYPQNLTFSYWNYIALDVAFNLSTDAFSEKTLSQMELRVNDAEIFETDLSEGTILFAEYPTFLNFTANTAIIYFNFTLTSHFSYEFELEIYSKTYLTKTITLGSPTSLYISSVMVDVEEITHFYLNYNDHGAVNSVNPSLVLVNNQWLRFDIILGEEFSIPLEILTMQNATATITLNGLTNNMTQTGISNGNLSINIPDGFELNQTNISISNLQYIEPYLSSSNVSGDISTETNNLTETTVNLTNSTQLFDYYNVSSVQNTTFNVNGSVLANIESGSYQGSWTFKNLTDGVNPFSTWFSTDSPVIGVEASYQQHNKIVGFSAVNAFNEILFSDGMINVANKYVEAWMCFPSFSGAGTPQCYFTLGGSVGGATWAGIHFEVFGSMHIRYNVANNYYDTGKDLTDFTSPNTWFKLRMEFDASNYMTLFINDQPCGSGYQATITQADRIQCSQGYSQISVKLDSLSHNFTTAQNPTYQRGDLAYLETGAGGIVNETYTLNFTSIQLNQIAAFNLSYSFVSNSTQTMNASILNFGENRAYSVSNHTGNSTAFFFNNTRSQNFFNTSIAFNITFYAYNSTNNFTLSIRNFSLIVYYYANASIQIAPELSVGFNSMVYVGQVNNISIMVQKTLNPIDRILISSNLFSNQTVGSTDGTYYYPITNVTAQTYNISIYVNDTSGSWKQFDVFNINILKNQSIFTFSQLYSSYPQNYSLNITTTSPQTVNISIYDPLGNRIITALNRTEFNIQYNRSGWYRINATFEGNSQFLGSSIESVFEVTPVIHAVGISDVEIKLNSEPILTNFTTLDSPEMNFTVNPGVIFDINIQCRLNYVCNFQNALEFSFNATQNITQITIFSANLTNPNYDVLYFEDGESWASICREYENRDGFGIVIMHNEAETLYQLSPNISTEDNAVEFRSFGVATRRFYNWYVTSEYDVESVEIYAYRSQALVSITNASDNYYFSLFTTQQNDVFRIDWDLNPHFDVDYEILANTSIIAMVVDVTTEIYVENVTVKCTPNFFVNDWQNATQSPITNEVSFTVSNLTVGTTRFYLNGSNTALIAGELGQSDSIVNYDETDVHFTQNFTATTALTSQFLTSPYLDNLVDLEINAGTIDYEIFGDWVYFIDSSAINETYIVNWVFNPNFEINPEIIDNTGVVIQIVVDISTEIPVENLSVNIPMDVYFTTWGNASQNRFSKDISFFISNLNFGLTRFFVDGSRPVPMAAITSLTSEYNMAINPTTNVTVGFAGRLLYSEYSEIWEIPVDPRWELDGVHYGNETYTISNNTFNCSGFDQSILSSELHFWMNPNLYFDVNKTATEIVLILTSDLPLNRTFLTFSVEIAGNYRILTDGVFYLYSIGNYRYFTLMDPVDLVAGENYIIISYETYNLSDNVWWYIAPLIVVGLVGIVYYFRKPKVGVR